MTPYYLYTGGVLKLVDREEPKPMQWDDFCEGDNERNIQYKNEQSHWQEWRKYVDQLPSIQVSDELKKVFVEGQRYENGKDFTLIYQVYNGHLLYDCYERVSEDYYKSFFERDKRILATPVNTLQEEKEDDLWNEVYIMIDNWGNKSGVELKDRLKSKYHITRKQQ